MEVKTRTNYNFGSPEEAVDYRKVARIRKLAAAYLNKSNAYYDEIRFDVIAINLQGNTIKINHIENAF